MITKDRNTASNEVSEEFCSDSHRESTSHLNSVKSSSSVFKCVEYLFSYPERLVTFGRFPVFFLWPARTLLVFL